MDEVTALDLYRMMTEIRLFEKRAYDLFLQNLVKGTTHLGTGQEAIAAGVARAMRPHDHTLVTSRGPGHLPRARARAGPRHADDPGPGGTAGPGERPDARQGRLDAPARCVPGGARLLRDHRGAARDRERQRLVSPVPGERPGHCLLLRRWRHEHRCLP